MPIIESKQRFRHSPLFTVITIIFRDSPMLDILTLPTTFEFAREQMIAVWIADRKRIYPDLREAGLGGGTGRSIHTSHLDKHSSSFTPPETRLPTRQTPRSDMG
jgi:hypothetical protein